MDLSLLKGTRDYLSSEQILREQVRDILVRTFRKYGYSPLETPILNTFELLSSKYAGGAEILKETYRLTDQGERDLALRYDLTVPFSRIVGFYGGLHKDLPLPFKRYEIGKVFRDGPVRSGRVREFTQCDVDIVGSEDISAEAELIAMAGEIFDQLGLPVVVRLNHRKILSAILLENGVEERNLSEAILSIDKLEKIGWKEVGKELIEKGFEKSSLEPLEEMLSISGSPDEVLSKLEHHLKSNSAEEALAQLRELLEILPALGFSGRIKLVPSLARGLEIYTGTVFECFLVDQRQIASSLAAGGRYDEIIGRFLESDQPDAFPSVGISFGLDVLYEALKQKQEAELPKTVTQVYIVPIGIRKEAFEIASRMRREGLCVDVGSSGKKIKKMFRYANQMNIPFVLTVGEDEIKEGKFNLKDMAKETEVRVSLQEAIQAIKEG